MGLCYRESNFDCMLNGDSANAPQHSNSIRKIPVEYVKIERALATISEELPDTPRWVALITLDGAIVRHYPTLMDGDRIAVLTHSLITQSRHLLTDTGSS